MKTNKKLGIWMDHSSAHLMEYKPSSMETKIIESTFTHQEKEHAFSKSENVMHNKEQHQQSEYYKNLSDVIKNYEEVILFGPTDAKVELLKVLRADLAYSKIEIEIKNADKMTENQKHAFVKEHFSKN